MEKSNELKKTLNLKDEHIERALKATSGIVKHAAKRLNVGEATLFRRFKKDPEKWSDIRREIRNAKIDIKINIARSKKLVLKSPSKRKPKNMNITDEMLIKALEATGGLLSHAAKKLNCSVEMFYKRFQRDAEKWQAIRDKIRDDRLDFAESKLMQAIDKGSTPELLFFLKCQGKSRGYIEKQEVKLSHSMDARLNPDYKPITKDMSPTEASRLYCEMIKRDKE